MCLGLGGERWGAKTLLWWSKIHLPKLEPLPMKFAELEVEGVTPSIRGGGELHLLARFLKFVDRVSHIYNFFLLFK